MKKHDFNLDWLDSKVWAKHSNKLKVLNSHTVKYEDNATDLISSTWK